MKKPTTYIKYINQKAKKAGLPPGTLVAPLPEESSTTTVKRFSFNQKSFKESTVTDTALLREVLKTKDVNWIDVVGLRDIKKLEALGKVFDLHPLLLEDILHADQRPKFDRYDNVLYIVVHMFYSNLKGDRIYSEQISIVFGENFVISFQEKVSGVFESVRQYIRDGYTILGKRGPDYLAYLLLNSVVDNYFSVLEKIGERIESLENVLLSNPNEYTLQKVNHLRQEALTLRRSIWPLRDVVSRFEREESPLLKQGTKIYVRDVYDHAVQAIEALETYRDILSGMVDLYLSSISNKMNAIMKVLTIISTIFIPLTFIAGVYGMNFQNFPEIKWKFGYLWALGLMLTVAVVMVGYFRRKKWF